MKVRVLHCPPSFTQRSINKCMDRELILTSITEGKVDDDAHIERCLHMLDNEPDDLIRIYAKLWLERNVVGLAQRVLKSQ